MGYKVKNNYDELNNPSTPKGEFFGGLFSGTLGFMITIGGWLISLFCYLGIGTQISGALAFAISLGFGIWLGVILARNCSNKDRKEKHEGQ